jgi:hypothetical protein
MGRLRMECALLALCLVLSQTRNAKLLPPATRRVHLPVPHSYPSSLSHCLNPTLHHPPEPSLHSERSEATKKTTTDSPYLFPPSPTAGRTRPPYPQTPTLLPPPHDHNPREKIPKEHKTQANLPIPKNKKTLYTPWQRKIGEVTTRDARTR